MVLRVMPSLVFLKVCSAGPWSLEMLYWKMVLQINKVGRCYLLFLILRDSQNMLAIESSEVSFSKKTEQIYFILFNLSFPKFILTQHPFVPEIHILWNTLGNIDLRQFLQTPWTDRLRAGFKMSAWLWPGWKPSYIFRQSSQEKRPEINLKFMALLQRALDR